MSRILLIEKESITAQHQTGYNKDVVHFGFYYTPGSLKAQFCQRGAVETADFCRQYQIDFQQRGKLLVATTHLVCDRM